MKNIFITGTSSGLGKIMAEHLHAAGYKVVGSSRNPKGDSPFPSLALDITKDDSVENAIEKFVKENGKIDVLVNNAGYGISGSIEETKMEDAISQMDSNFFGTVRMNKAVLPHMRKQKEGLIINVSSIGGLLGLPFQGFYSASKFALEGYTEALRMETKDFNVKVVNVNPGDFKTSFTANRVFTENPDSVYNEQFKKAVEIFEKDEQSGADPIEVAKLIERLIKKESGHKVRYLVGAPIQKLAVYLKGILGSRIFEKIIAGSYS